ncbi:MAG: tetratricopeptide repeat protein [Pseudomonadota bacterium]|nr:tetratricopeptide repeat protein [Pseudomonadota bacterium]
MNPSPAHEQLLRRLRQQLHYHNGGASVVYLFSDYTLANQWLMAELDAHLQTKSMRLDILTPVSATEAPVALLQPILASGNQDMVGRHYWLALGNPAPEWDDYRDRILARLNESRVVLVKNRAFIFLMLPPHFESRAAEVAPDLWSVRSASYVVAPWSGRDESLTVPADISPESERTQGGVPPIAAGNPVLRNWQAQWEAWNRDRSQQLSPSLAWLLVDELLKQQKLEQLDQARTVAMQALELCRQLRVVKADTPESRRDLSISLNKVGDAESAVGRGEQALTAYRESLEIRRQLRQALGDSPQVLRDLSVALNKVGDAESAAGRGEQALAAYRESLEIRRQLRQALGDSPQVLRDLSVSLEKVGNAESAAGRGEQALAAYRESLEIRRQLRQALGDSPQVLRDLSVALNKVGDAESAAGRGEQALAAYQESLKIDRQLRQALGDSPQVLRDLSVSLNKVGNAESTAERGEQALAAYRESLEIFRQLRQALGDSPQVLRDLSVSLNKVGNAESAAGRGEQALAAYRESLEIFRQLRQALGDSPQVLRDLSVALNKEGEAESAAGRGEQALAAYRESLKIDRQLRQALGDSPQVLDDLAVSLERLASQSGLEIQERKRHFDEALSLREQLVSALPQNTKYRQRLEVLRSLAPSLPAPSAGAS